MNNVGVQRCWEESAYIPLLNGSWDDTLSMEELEEIRSIYIEDNTYLEDC